MLQRDALSVRGMTKYISGNHQIHLKSASETLVVVFFNLRKQKRLCAELSQPTAHAPTLSFHRTLRCRERSVLTLRTGPGSDGAEGDRGVGAAAAATRIWPAAAASLCGLPHIINPFVSPPPHPTPTQGKMMSRTGMILHQLTQKNPK